MIDIKNKIDCCGCQACGDICPKDVISFKMDEEGIWYPEINKDRCIDCHLCEKVCPIINRVSRPDNSNNPITYVLQAPNPIDRLNSASGAAYTLLVREVFKKGGYVAGHIWDSNYSVKGYISCNPGDLPLLQSTKYLQSNVEGMYKAVKNLLNQGKFVLFSGCPCQNAAMHSFLRKDYDNLVMTDFTCMGIDSPLAFKKYIESLESQYQSKVIFFKAKSKEVGWRYLTNKAIFENGKTYYGINGRDANLNATFLNVLVRPSCYDCKFKGFPRISDMTIGDYWRTNYDDDSLDDNTGTSYVILNNKKAEDLFGNVLPHCSHRKINYTEILGANPLAMKSLAYPKFDRHAFYDKLSTENFNTLVDGLYKEQKSVLSSKRKLLRALKNILASAYYNRYHPLSFISMLYYNVFSSKVKSDLGNGDVLIIRNVKLNLGKNALVKVRGHCILDGNNKSGKIEMRANSSLHLDNNYISGGSQIELGSNGSLTIGYKTIIGESVSIKSTSKVDIGEFSLIDNGSIIDDSDSGIVYFDGTLYDNKTISLGTHTLISRNAIVKGGTTLGDDTIVREFSSVKGKYPSRSVLEGTPAKIVDKDINWKHNFDFIWNYKN